MQYIPADFVGLAFIPFTLFIFLMVHNRSKFKIVDMKLHQLEVWVGESKSKQIQVIIIAFIFALVWSFIIGIVVFPFSDVDEAMVAGIQGFLNGNNPYTENIVPHILLTPSGKLTVYGTYNYGPIDLVIYAVGYMLLSPIFGDVWWLFVTNIVFLIFIYFVLAKLTFNDISHTIKVIPFMFLMGWFLQDNSVLMCLILAIAWYIHIKIDINKKYKFPLITIILTLGLLTKLYIAFVLVGYFVYVFKSDIILWIQNTLIGLITTVIVISPFNIFAVIRSIFLFHSDLEYRETYSTIQGGIPAILEIIGLKELFIAIAILYGVLVILLSYIYAKDQLALYFCVLTIFFLLLLPNSVFAFFIIPAFFMLSQYYDNLSKNSLN